MGRWVLCCSCVALISSALAYALGWGHILSCTQDAKPERHELTASEIENLVKQLGSNNSHHRDSAFKALVNVGQAVLPFLKDVKNASDIEVRRAAAAVEKEIRENRLRRQMIKATSLGIDYYVARLLRDRKTLSNEDWETLSAIEGKLKDLGRTNGVQNLETLNSTAFPKVIDDAYVNKRGLLVNTCLSAASIKSHSIFGSIVLCPEALNVDGLDGCLAIIGKDAGARLDAAGRNVVVCNGDFDTKAAHDDSVIVCNGNVTIPVGVRLLVVAKGTVKINEAIACRPHANAKIVFDKVPFFGPELIGLDVEPTNGSVIVRKIRPDSAFGKSGVKAADMICAIDGVPVISADHFAGLLLASVVARKGELTLSRDGTNLKTPVRFDGPEFDLIGVAKRP